VTSLSVVLSDLAAFAYVTIIDINSVRSGDVLRDVAQRRFALFTDVSVQPIGLMLKDYRRFGTTYWSRVEGLSTFRYNLLV
jgi:hypothetical protein